MHKTYKTSIGNIQQTNERIEDRWWWSENWLNLKISKTSNIQNVSLRRFPSTMSIFTLIFWYSTWVRKDYTKKHSSIEVSKNKIPLNIITFIQEEFFLLYHYRWQYHSKSEFELIHCQSNRSEYKVHSRKSVENCWFQKYWHKESLLLFDSRYPLVQPIGRNLLRNRSNVHCHVLLWSPAQNAWLNWIRCVTSTDQWYCWSKNKYLMKEGDE